LKYREMKSEGRMTRKHLEVAGFLEIKVRLGFGEVKLGE